MIDIKKKYNTKHCGKIKILNYTNCSVVEVEFVNTGYRTYTQASNITNGSVKDRLLKSVYGVGFVGHGKYKGARRGVGAKRYKTWTGMLERCYSDKLHTKNPTYIGCTVCPEWHNFQVFAEWYDKHYIEGHHLDKDIKVNGNKVYSPETCLFVSQGDNTIKAHAKCYRFRSPKNIAYDIYNMADFCRGRDINNKGMSAVANGVQSHHKGWTFEK